VQIIQQRNNKNEMEIAMKTIRLNTMYGWLAVATLLMTLAPAQAEKPSADDTVSVSMTVTASVADGKRMPNILPNDIQVRSGKERLQVTDWSAARGNRAGLDLFILIDDASDPILGLQLDDLRKFIADQPATTRIGVGYMRNATLQIAQDFTSDHGKAAASVRLPLGSAGAYGSAYRSAVDLMKRWPESGNRREILMLPTGSIACNLVAGERVAFKSMLKSISRARRRRRPAR
jgi:hypothetical protein